MFFIISKLLFFFINPFTWIVASLLLFFIIKNPKWKKRMKITSLVCLLFFSNTFIFLEFERMWEIPGTPIKNVKKYEVGIVLGGMFEYNNDLKRLSVRRGADRIWQAVSLYKAGKIQKIFVSGGSGYVTGRGLYEGEQLKKVLVKWGIPEQDILEESISKNTYENAIETKKVLTRSYPHFKRFLLITSAQHMRRARAIFKKQDLPCDTFTTDHFTGSKREVSADQLLVPSALTIADWNGLIKEWVGYIIYDVAGYL